DQVGLADRPFHATQVAIEATEIDAAVPGVATHDVVDDIHDPVEHRNSPPLWVRRATTSVQKMAAISQHARLLGSGYMTLLSSPFTEFSTSSWLENEVLPLAPRFSTMPSIWLGAPLFFRT